MWCRGSCVRHPDRRGGDLIDRSAQQFGKGSGVYCHPIATDRETGLTGRNGRSATCTDTESRRNAVNAGAAATWPPPPDMTPVPSDPSRMTTETCGAIQYGTFLLVIQCTDRKWRIRRYAYTNEFDKWVTDREYDSRDAADADIIRFIPPRTRDRRILAVPVEAVPVAVLQALDAKALTA